jgi:hypothetical protein
MAQTEPREPGAETVISNYAMCALSVALSTLKASARLRSVAF